MSEIEIRLCKTWDECVRCEELQKRIWEMPDYRDVVPANLLITAIKSGGILVGAFDKLDMVGFAFGFLGSESDPEAPPGQTRRLKHTSHMLGVLPNVRTRGLGAQLKLRQRREALAQGLGLMTWTYDPLQAVNAHLNLARLGAIARRYYRNTYGEMTDALNAGVASDRFEVEWLISSSWVAQRVSGQALQSEYPNIQPLYRVGFDKSGLPQIVHESPVRGVRLSVEIPSDFNGLKETALELAVEWRERTRDTFERAFAAGYVAVDFLRKMDLEGRLHTLYVLQRELPLFI